MRDVAGTGRGGVSMAGGQLPARPRRKKGKRGEGQSLAITAMLCSEFAYVFRLFFSMKEVAENIRSMHTYI